MENSRLANGAMDWIADETYEDPGQVKVELSRLADVLDGAANPDGVVVVVVRAGGQLDGVLGRHEVRPVTLIVVRHEAVTEEVGWRGPRLLETC